LTIGEKKKKVVFIFFQKTEAFPFFLTLRGDDLVVMQRYAAHPILVAQVAIAEL
jgi:hypothetical protein